MAFVANSLRENQYCWLYFGGYVPKPFSRLVPKPFSPTYQSRCTYKSRFHGYGLLLSQVSVIFLVIWLYSMHDAILNAMHCTKGTRISSYPFRLLFASSFEVDVDLVVWLLRRSLLFKIVFRWGGMQQHTSAKRPNQPAVRNTPIAAGILEAPLPEVCSTGMHLLPSSHHLSRDFRDSRLPSRDSLETAGRVTQSDRIYELAASSLNL